MNKLPTIVTAIYNIRQMEGSSHEHTMQLNKYIELASQFILTLPYPLVIFIDDSLTPDAQELEKTIIEKRQPFPGKTHIYKELFANTYFYKDINKLIELEDTFNIVNINKAKDSPRYIILNNNKFHFMEKAIDTNFANSSHFIWIDFGINHVAKDPHIIHEWIMHIPDKIKQLCVNPYIDAGENKENFKNIWHHTAGGLFSGNIENLKLYSRLFKEKVAQIYEEEWYQLDEAIMTMVQRENPDLFEFFYGDYDGIIANYAGAKYSLNIIFAGLKKCFLHNNTRFAYKILRYLDSYFLKEENQGTKYFYEYISYNIICCYYQNNALLHINVVDLINKHILKGDESMIILLKNNSINLDFYKNRGLLI
jgi:hypothetical protein